MSAPDRSKPPVVRQGELIREIGSLLAGRLPGDWAEAVLEVKQAGSYGEHLCHLTGPDGQSWRESTPDGVYPLAQELRAVMYKSGAGTWYTMRYTVTRTPDGQAHGHTSFNYDDAPHWDMTPVPYTFIEDLQTYPRDTPHIPDWLNQHIENARPDHPQEIERLKIKFYRDVSMHPDGFEVWGGLFRRERENDVTSDAVFYDNYWHFTGRLMPAFYGGKLKVREVSATAARAFLNENWGLGTKLYEPMIIDEYEEDPTIRPDWYIPLADRTEDKRS